MSKQKQQLMHYGRVLDDVLSHLRSRGGSLTKKLRTSVERLTKFLPKLSFQVGVDPEMEKQKLVQVVSFARSYLEVIYDHFPQFSRFRGEQQLSIILEALTYNNFEKCCKWVTSAPEAIHLRNRAADKPQDDIHLVPFSDPRVRHYLTNIIRGKMSRKTLHFTTSLLQGVKRACAPPSECMKAKQLASHSEGLQKPPPELREDLRRHLRRALQGIRQLRTGHIKDTGGASNQTTRSMGGKWEEVIRLWNGVSLDEPLCDHELYFMTPTRSFYGRDIPTWSQVRTLISKVDCVKAVALLEPLKVRVITTGDAATSLYLEPHRKKLHDFLRKIPALKPLDDPKVKESDIEDLLTKEAKLGLQFTHWVSGDYSAATDNLNMNATKQTLEVILQMLGREDDMEILLRSLTEAQLKYPNSDLDGLQRNGQLMGNPMSFPILCLVNLVGYWMSLEKYLNRSVDIMDLPVLVNGDDILFRADQTFHDIWKDQIHSLGFSLSVGKYYFHKRVATLNSQFFIDGKEVRYYNPGLLYKDYGYAGNKKKCHYLPVEQIATEFLGGCWSLERGWTQFKHYWGSTIDIATSGGMQNLFLPRSAGGLGAIAPPGLSYHVTIPQKRIAYGLHMMQNWHPLEAARWTNTPMRESLNSSNSVKKDSHSKRLVWLSDHVDDVLDNKLKSSFVDRTSLSVKMEPVSQFAQTERQEVFPTFIMGSHLLSLEQIGIPEDTPFSLMNKGELRESNDLVPIPHIVKPSLDMSQFELYESEVQSVPQGAQRAERSFTSEDKLWWRRMSKRNVSQLMSWFHCPRDLPEPVGRRLYRFTGDLRHTE